MAHYLTLPLTTEIESAAMATYIFAMGDSKFYTRLLWPVQIEDATTHLMRACNLADVVEAGAQMAELTESYLQSITMSIKHDPDEANIPASDVTAEDTMYALMQAPPIDKNKGPETFQIRVPNCGPTVNKQSFNDRLAYFRMPGSGRIPTLCVNANGKRDRRARASV